nr:CapA family protein [Halobellus inordinatus]
MSLRIGLTGDVMLGRLVDERQWKRPVAVVWGDLLDTLCDLDGLFINLECALSARSPQRPTYCPRRRWADA